MVDYLRSHRGLTVILLTLAIAILFISVVLLIRSSTPLIVLDLRAEYVVQQVKRPELAAVPLDLAKQTVGRPCPGAETEGGMSGVLRPERGAIVRYRWSPDRVAVIVHAPEREVDKPPPDTLLTYVDASGAERECRLRDRRNAFVFDVPSDSALAWALPIAGPAEVGIELGVPNVPQPGRQRNFNLLIDGELHIYGKAAMWPYRNALFLAVGDPLVVPAASRLAASPDVTARGSQAGDPWYGIAVLKENGFRISATTQSSELHMFRPGVEEGQREYFAIGLFASIFGDPSLAFFTFVFLVLVTVAQLVSGWVGVWKQTRSGTEFLLLAVAISTCLLPTSSAAERVLIEAASGEVGHGWLFGPRRSNARTCWIAAPRHVVRDPFSGELKPFLFETVARVGGESEVPISVDEVPGALEATGGVGDLMFARVAAGPTPGECLSRLGLPTYAYASILRTAPELAIFSMLPSSFGVFRAAVRKARSDPTAGGLLEIRAMDPRDAETYFKRGISGSVAEVERPQAAQPFAMILQVSEQELLARALRFDLIRGAFDIVEAADLKRGRAERAATEGIPFRIDGFEGINRSDGAGPTSLKDPSVCWRVAARGGSPAIRVAISLADPDDAIRGVSVVQAASCGTAPVPLTIEQRRGKEGSWSVAAECMTVPTLEARPSCALDLRGPRHLRLGIRAGGTIGLSQLLLH